jgi:hypothetical protein
MATKVDLYMSIDDVGSETFKNFTGYIPQKGDYVEFYKKMHNGQRYCGVVTDIETRIEYKTQNDNKQRTKQSVIVKIKWKDTP